MKLFANISVGHENSKSVLDARIVAAAQCNADAVVLTKTTPRLVIPDEKKYVAIQSKWGTKPYIEVAKLSELNQDTTEHVTNLCESIGIQLIWSVTDQEALQFVKDHSNINELKIHNDAVGIEELLPVCYSTINYTYFPYKHIDLVNHYYQRKRKKFALYHTTEGFAPEIEELKLSVLDKIKHLNYNTGYESKEAGIFPAMATMYKGIEYLEAYLGESSNNMPGVLTPHQLFDLWNSCNILLTADTEESY
jgi:sialic acid synthase SpsE